MLMAGEVAAAHLAFEGLMAGVEMEKAEMLATSPAADSAHITYFWQWNGHQRFVELLIFTQCFPT
jgi:hypothetical protein